MRTLDVVVVCDPEDGADAVNRTGFGGDEAGVRIEHSRWIQDAHVTIDEEDVSAFAEFTTL
jgi:hypothetical protein